MSASKLTDGYAVLFEEGGKFFYGYHPLGKPGAESESSDVPAATEADALEWMNARFSDVRQVDPGGWTFKTVCDARGRPVAIKLGP